MSLDNLRILSGDGSKPQCPHCASQRSHVIDSRGAHGMFYRRRVCIACKDKYITQEVVIPLGGKSASKVWRELMEGVDETR